MMDNIYTYGIQPDLGKNQPAFLPSLKKSPKNNKAVTKKSGSLVIDNASMRTRPDFKKPIAVLPTSPHYAGYSWRGTSLTRQDLICLLIFTQDMDNRNTGLVLGVTAGTVHKRSASLRRRLGFKTKQEMVLATKEAGFLTIFPDNLVDSLFDELTQKKLNKKNKLSI